MTAWSTGAKEAHPFFASPKLKSPVWDAQNGTKKILEVKTMSKSYSFEPCEVQNHQSVQLEAAPGFKYITVKFVALLTCIVAWLAGERWRLDALADNDPDIYAILASKMSAAYTVSSDVNLRDIVENVDLGLCFGDISCSDLIEQGIDRKTTRNFERAWKKANPAISDLGQLVASDLSNDWWKHPGFLFGQKDDDHYIQLCSDRVLLFRSTEADVDDLNRPYLIYHRYSPEGNTYRAASGRELLKMIANEIAIDLLNAFVSTALERENYRIVSNRFNEIVLEVPDHVLSQFAVTGLLGDMPEWTHGLPLRVEASECTLTPGNDPVEIWERSTILGSHVYMASDYTLTPDNGQQDHPEQ